MYFVRLSVVLLLIAGIASGILAYVNQLTDPVIKKNQAEAERIARSDVLSEAKDFAEHEKDGFKYFDGLDDNGNVIGYTFIAYGPGYSSTIQTMVGVNKELEVQNIKIIYQSETPGLGANCVKDDFAPRFEKQTMTTLKVDKDGGKIASITGATITTRAITKSISAGIKSLSDAVAAE